MPTVQLPGYIIPLFSPSEANMDLKDEFTIKNRLRELHRMLKLGDPNASYEIGKCVWAIKNHPHVKKEGITRWWARVVWPPGDKDPVFSLVTAYKHLNRYLKGKP